MQLRAMHHGFKPLRSIYVQFGNTWQENYGEINEENKGGLAWKIVVREMVRWYMKQHMDQEKRLLK